MTPNERARKYRERHPDRVRASTQRYYAKHGDRARAASRRYNHANIEERRAYRFAYDLMRFYGITPEDYEAMFAAQDGRCAICREPETAVHQSGVTKRLAVDHDAATGRVRGLLCSRHNTMIGLAGHNPFTLRHGADYLERTA